jgi:capsular polysaccharide biosynthesis protein
MEFSFLKKHTRAHKYLAHFSQAEINAVLNQYVPQLRSIQIFNSKIVPMEVKDEYHENVEKIVQEVREVFKNKLRTKIQNKIGDPVIARIYASSF